MKGKAHILGLTLQETEAWALSWACCSLAEPLGESVHLPASQSLVIQMRVERKWYLVSLPALAFSDAINYIFPL